MATPEKYPSIKVKFGSDGLAVWAENMDGTPLAYDGDDKMSIAGAELSSNCETGYENEGRETETDSSQGIRVEFDEDGLAVRAENIDGTPIVYDPADRMSIPGAELSGFDQVRATRCCWRKIAGVWKCRTEYCRYFTSGEPCSGQPGPVTE